MNKQMTAMAILSFILVGALTFIGLNLKNQNKAYTSFESDIKESALAYLKTKEIDLGVGDSMRVSIDELIENNYLESNKVEEDTCDGYIVVTRNNYDYTYKPYIKCSNYTTEDYE